MIQIYTLFFWCWICFFFKLIVYPVKTWHSSWHSKVIETIKIKTNSIIYITSVHVSLIRWLISYRQNPAVCMTEQYTRLYCIECVGSQWGALITGFMLSFSGFCHNNKNYVWWKTTTYFEILLEKFSSHSFKSRISTLKDFFFFFFGCWCLHCECDKMWAHTDRHIWSLKHCQLRRILHVMKMYDTSYMKCSMIPPRHTFIWCWS